MYDILHEIRYNIGHGGKHRMIAETKKKYKNITQEINAIYNNISSEEDLENVLQNIGGKSEESNSVDANQVNRKNNK